MPASSPANNAGFYLKRYFFEAVIYEDNIFGNWGDAASFGGNLMERKPK